MRRLAAFLLLALPLAAQTKTSLPSGARMWPNPAAGTIFYVSSSVTGSLAALGLGALDTCLKSGLTAPVWGACGTGDVTDVNITTNTPLNGGGTCASGACSYTLGLSALVDADISNSAAIAWSKVSKSGAVAGDVGAVALQDSTPGTAQTGNVNVDGVIRADGGLKIGHLDPPTLEVTATVTGNPAHLPAGTYVYNAATIDDDGNTAGASGEQSCVLSDYGTCRVTVVSGGSGLQWGSWIYSNRGSGPVRFVTYRFELVPFLTDGYDDGSWAWSSGTPPSEADPTTNLVFYPSFGELVALRMQTARLAMVGNIDMNSVDPDGGHGTTITLNPDGAGPGLGQVTSSSFVGALTGNASTASALAADPTDCLVAGQYATTIAANGNLGCAAVAYSDVSGTPSLAAVATSGSASDLGSGTLAAARGGAGTITGALKGNGSGVVSQAACADLSDAGTGCSATLATVATSGSASDLGTGTLGVAQGGTGGSTATAYGVVLTGTTSTGAFKLDIGPGTSGYALTSNGAGAYPTWQATSGGANTALSNLSSVAINAALATGAGTALSLAATAPAQITTAQAGTSATFSTSDGVAGSSVAGAAAGGSVTWNLGAAARLTSGNANGGDFTINFGAGIGTGRRGTFSIPGAGANSEALGLGAIAGGARTTAVGNAANGVTYTDATAVGYNVTIGSNDSVAIGSGASTANTAGVGKNVAIGKTATASNAGGIAIGETATASSGSSISIGQSALASGNSGPVCIGASCLASNSTGSVVIGNASSANSTTANVVVGSGATTTASNQLLLGGTTSSITTGYVGKGVTSTTASAVTFGTTGGSGTDNAGANWIQLPGVGTGTAASGDWYVKTGVPRATGTTAQSPAVRQYIRSKQVTLTESTATNVVTIPVAASKIVGGKILYTISSNDGTDFQSTSGEAVFAAVDKASTVTTAITQSAETTAASAGTLTSTWTAVASTTNVILKCNAVSSLTQTVLEVHYQLWVNGDDVTGTVTSN